MKKFEDFKQLMNKSIADVQAIFLRAISKVRGLAKEVPQNDICFKVLKCLPSTWNMKVTTMRYHRDLITLSTDKLFSDLKACRFEMSS